MRCVLALLMSAVLLTSATAQTIQRLDGSTITPAEMDSTVTRLMKAAEVTGVGITIFNHGEVAYQKAYGVRDQEKNLPLTPDSVMTGASLTKAAFGYLVLQLVDAKVIDLDKPLYQYLPKPLPEYSNYSDLANDPRYKKITARMVLDHTTGFPNWRSLNEDRKLNINFEPGAHYAYSGEGIDLLQLIVETATGKPLEELMQKNVFQPFGMTRTSMMWQPAFDSDFANGYDEYGRSLGAERWKRSDAAGSMQTTPRDFARFMQAVMQGTRLSQETRKQMLSPQIQIFSKHQFPPLENEPTDENKAIRLSYGLGFGLYWSSYGEAFFKEGHDEGWRNYAVCFEQSKDGIVIMSNSSNAEGIFKELLETLLHDTFTPIEWEGFTPYDKLPPRPSLPQHKEVAIDPKTLDGLVGRYVLNPQIALTITRAQGTHLWVQENDEPKQELAPEGERKFFSTTADDEYTFNVDSSGRVTEMVLHTDGRDIPIKRGN